MAATEDERLVAAAMRGFYATDRHREITTELRWLDGTRRIGGVAALMAQAYVEGARDAGGSSGMRKLAREMVPDART